MSKQMKQLVEAEEMKREQFNWKEEMDWINEQEQIARVQREKEHKIAMKDVALHNALVMSLAGIIV